MENNFKIYLPRLDDKQCEHLQNNIGSSMCFSIQIPVDIEEQDVESAELWVYKQPHIMNQSAHFLIGEIYKWNETKILKTFAIQHTNDTGKITYEHLKLKSNI